MPSIWLRVKYTTFYTSNTGECQLSLLRKNYFWFFGFNLRCAQHRVVWSRLIVHPISRRPPGRYRSSPYIEVNTLRPCLECRATQSDTRSVLCCRRMYPQSVVLFPTESPAVPSYILWIGILPSSHILSRANVLASQAIISLRGRGSNGCRTSVPMSTNPWNMLLIDPCEWTCIRPPASWMRSMIGLSYLVLKSLKSFGPCRGGTLYSWPSIEKKEPIFWDRRNLTCYITICICRSQRWWMVSRSVMHISAKFSEPHSSVTKPPGLNPIPLRQRCPSPQPPRWRQRTMRYHRRHLA